MGKLVSKTYGDALFEVAFEENRIDEFFEASKVVTEVFHTHQDFRELINLPQIIKEDKVKIMQEIFAGKVPEEMIRLMRLMVMKGRTKEMQEVFQYFIDRVKEEKGIGIAKVTTAVSLSQAQKWKIEQKLLETTKYQTFEMCYQIDETLIGGMIIQIGERVIDSSIRTKLYDLSRELRKIQV